MQYNISIIIFFVFVSLVSSCGQTNGVSPDLVTATQRIVLDCDTTIASDKTKAEFEALLQDGTSSTDLFTICLNEGVEVNSGGSDHVEINNKFVQVAGYSATTSKIHGLSFYNTDTTNMVSVYHITIVGSISGLTSHALRINGGGSSIIKDANIEKTVGGMEAAVVLGHTSASHTITGTSIVNNLASTMDTGCIDSYETTTTVDSSSCTTSGRIGISSFSQSNSVTMTVKNSTVTALEEGIQIFQQSNAGVNTYSLSGNTITTSGCGIFLGSQANATVTGDISDNIIRYNGDGSGMGTACGVQALIQSNGPIVINDDSSAAGNLICKTASATGTISSVFSQVIQSGGSIQGTFSAATTQNGSNTNILSCP